MSTQFLAPAVVPEEEELEQSLRPRRLAEFVGQERIKDQLAIALTAAKAREESLDHVLLVGDDGRCQELRAHAQAAFNACRTRSSGESSGSTAASACSASPTE